MQIGQVEQSEVEGNQKHGAVEVFFITSGGSVQTMAYDVPPTCRWFTDNSPTLECAHQFELNLESFSAEHCCCLVNDEPEEVPRVKRNTMKSRTPRIIANRRFGYLRIIRILLSKSIFSIRRKTVRHVIEALIVE
ncbi:hypothetical protein GCK72_013752 [Caenorhabditis remanei]|uniref:Uncharacterized protein n=1 Tax=Caenorhabditis remanei TaxID=31234 RepID=A0A6A5GQ25_CAERE|nr:hypothetical protein GCK72_013752 [Caenorhabditis remanei]KAF1757297.1 hypothetical protein GCK72_013752 [Caenorhabditis remanei]